MDRRGFLGSILAAGVAPAFVGSGVLMPLGRALPPKIIFTDNFEGLIVDDLNECWNDWTPIPGGWTIVSNKLEVGDVYTKGPGGILTPKRRLP